MSHTILEPNPPLNPDLTTRGKVRELLRRGWTPTTIGRYLRITRQAVYEHMEKLRAEAEEAAG